MLSAAVESNSAQHSLPPELCEHIGFVLTKVRERFWDSVAGIFGQFNVSGRHFGILLLTTRRGGVIRQSDIAGALRIDRTTAMHCVDELEAAALIRRQPHPADRRAHAVTITASGQRIIKRMTPLLEEAERRFLSRLSVAERKTLLELLSRLVTT